MEETHTPLPWKHEQGPRVFGQYSEVADADGNVIAECALFDASDAQDAANAAFICKAVNSHHRLVEALRAWYAPYDGWSDAQLERRADPATIRAVIMTQKALAELERS